MHESEIQIQWFNFFEKLDQTQLSFELDFLGSLTFAFLFKWINPNKIKIDSFKWIILSVPRSLSSSVSFPPFSCCLSLPELITMITNFSVLCFQCCFFEQKSRFCDGKLSYCFPMIMIFLLLSLCACLLSFLSPRIENILAVPACRYSNSCSLIIWQTNHAWDSRKIFSPLQRGLADIPRDYNELVEHCNLERWNEWLMIIVSGTRQVHCQSQLALRCLHFLSWRTIEDTHTWDDSEKMRSDPGWSACLVNSFLFYSRQSYANNLETTACAHETAGEGRKVKSRQAQIIKHAQMPHTIASPSACVRCDYTFAAIAKPWTFNTKGFVYFPNGFVIFTPSCPSHPSPLLAMHKTFSFASTFKTKLFSC